MRQFQELCTVVKDALGDKVRKLSLQTVSRTPHAFSSLVNLVSSNMMSRSFNDPKHV